MTTDSPHPEDLILNAYFGQRVPKRQLTSAIRGLQLDGAAIEGSIATELDAAVAATLLRSIRDDLPQWAVVEDGHVTLGRNNSARVRVNRFRPKCLFVLNWADSGPGFSWPMAYHVVRLRDHKRVIVTASADGPDTYGFADFAIGSFDITRKVLEGAREVVVAHWSRLAEEGQKRWAYLFDEGLVSFQLAEQWADAVWLPASEDEDDDDE